MNKKEIDRLKAQVDKINYILDGDYHGLRSRMNMVDSAISQLETKMNRLNLLLFTCKECFDEGGVPGFIPNFRTGFCPKCGKPADQPKRQEPGPIGGMPA